MKLYSQEHHDLVTCALIEILQAQLSVAEKASTSEAMKGEMSNIIVNVQFLVNSLVPVMKKTYEDVTGHTCLDFDRFSAVLRRLKKFH